VHTLDKPGSGSAAGTKRPSLPTLVSYPATRHSSARSFRAAEADPQSRSAARVIIALGTVVGLIVILARGQPVGTDDRVHLAPWHGDRSAAYLWLDRWEPEPRGCCCSHSSGARRWPSCCRWPWKSPSSRWSHRRNHRLGAPLIEEAAKGCSCAHDDGRRRNELNSLTDCLVYAGITAAGSPGWRTSSTSPTADARGVAGHRGVRLVMGHSRSAVHTMTYRGVLALQQRRRRRQGRLHPARLCGAVLMHALWTARR